MTTRAHRGRANRSARNADEGGDGILLAASDLLALLKRLEPDARRQPERNRVVRVPGRVNLIGEHTDYNEGFVLPAAIDLEVQLAFVPTDDRRVEITLADGAERRGFALDAIGPAGGAWIDYVAATAWSLAEAGVAVRGFRGVLSSSLPASVGLASSAAIELAAAWALAQTQGRQLDPLVLAQRCQHGENAYVGVNCGLMDQAAESLAEAGCALLLDCRTLDSRSVRLPLEEYQLVVCDTGSRRRLSASQYNARRAECEAAALLLASEDPSIRTLRDVTPEMLTGIRSRLDSQAYRRAEHVVRENQRVQQAVVALEGGDMPTVGELFAESHASLRDLYDVSSPELDAMVEVAAAVPGVVATRMTGAGFGGCTVSLVERGAGEDLQTAVMARYPARTGLTPRVFAVESAAGASLLQPDD